MLVDTTVLVFTGSSKYRNIKPESRSRPKDEHLGGVESRLSWWTLKAADGLTPCDSIFGTNASCDTATVSAGMTDMYVVIAFLPRPSSLMAFKSFSCNADEKTDWELNAGWTGSLLVRLKLTVAEAALSWRVKPMQEKLLSTDSLKTNEIVPRFISRSNAKSTGPMLKAVVNGCRPMKLLPLISLTNPLGRVTYEVFCRRKVTRMSC
jgi:hypothetical protein